MDIILFSLHDSLVRSISVSLFLNEKMDVQRGLLTCSVPREAVMVSTSCRSQRAGLKGTVWFDPTGGHLCPSEVRVVCLLTYAKHGGHE